MLRKFVVLAAVALAGTVPAGAEEGKPSGTELRITGTVLRASEQAVAVENAEGDATLTCVVPERLAEKASALKPGDRIKMVCVRHRGKKAQLAQILRPGTAKDERKAERKEAVGPIVELGEDAIVVQGHARVTCRVPEEKQAKLTGLKLGDKVKIACADGRLVGLERYAAEKVDKPAGEEVRIYGRIAELSQEAVTVRGEAGSLTCRVPAGVAEKLARFAVGDAVKMMCRGAELTYLEKV